MLANVAYNLLMLAVLGAAVFHLSRNRTFLWFKALGVALAATALVVAAVMGVGLERTSFASMRLMCFGVFVHAPLYAAAGCVLLWQASRVGAVIAAVLAVLLAAIGVDAFFVEPHWLEVTHYEIRSNKIDRPLRIAVLADIQTDDVGEYERDVLRRAMAEKPDLIVFPGDYLQTPSVAAWQAQRDLLRQAILDAKLDAPLGMFAVAGNVDYRDWPQVFEGTRVVAIDETRSVDLDLGDGRTVRITGLSERDSFERSGADDRSAPAGVLHLCVGHRPDFALGSPQADVLIAGHTHGGQVQLPIVGPLLTLSRVRRSWAEGLNEIRPGQHLFVSRGIGMERGEAPRLRFLCRPELAILDVVPE